MLASGGCDAPARQGLAPAPAVSGAVSCVVGLTLSGVHGPGASAPLPLAVELPTPSSGRQGHCAANFATHAAFTAWTRAGLATAPFLQRLQPAGVAAFEHFPVSAIQAHGSLFEGSASSSCW